MSPTVQAWFSVTDHPLASNPYPLYAASNAGSLFALLAYPILIEPSLRLAQQSSMFTWGYGTLVLLSGLAAVHILGMPKGVPLAAEAVTVDRAGYSAVRVVGLGFVPSLLLMGVTRHLSTDVASFPLLWVIPLAIYLATFIVAFGTRSRRLVAPATLLGRLLVVPVVLVGGWGTRALWLTVLLPLLFLAVASFLAHERLYERRPAARSLTGFYVWISVGGALGGIAGALVAPWVFDEVLEYPIAVVLAAIFLGSVRPTAIRKTRPGLALFAALIVGSFAVTEESTLVLLLGLAGTIAFLMARSTPTFVGAIALLAVANLGIGLPSQVLDAERTFYGVYRVLDTGDTHRFTSGTTLHGDQAIEAGRLSIEPLGYYHRTGPAGQVFTQLIQRASPLDIGIVGLGVGSLAAYGRQGDQITFYELDPEVVRIAREPSLFTHLAESSARISSVVGDGRSRLEQLRPQHDVLVIDAFSSDAIPVHLLTAEAFETYLRVIGDDGLLLIHLSNRHIELEGVLGRLAVAMELEARIARFVPDDAGSGAAASIWAIVARELSPALVTELDWEPLRTDGPLWTDDYSNIFEAIRWE